MSSEMVEPARLMALFEPMLLKSAKLMAAFKPMLLKSLALLRYMSTHPSRVVRRSGTGARRQYQRDRCKP
jgi:hypothetical protein